ncbi:iron-sulfur cluster assembly scaffold protein [Sulfurimonas sp. HSL-3221]|uniref:iron-sulfur cluster assembly scaffold protein n=1 Tax=Sulfurimonadaceae TaxID=2771471 RepID=UPI001E5FBF09|nr:iron-sulfur cluster assembly scaffold protein [Sulfurimonas sp. HSL-3221]UFS61521.1 iron-sulfur cluster assembly scaffold protein [Sulfurimonas sp. HSL-3221]
MARDDLIGGALWEEYSTEVQRRMNDPINMGELTEADAGEDKLVIADFGAESCGDAVRLYWLIDPSTDTIKVSKFKSFGCGTAIASSDMMAELCMGKTVDDALKITNIDVEKALRDDPDVPAVPGQKMHCSVMAYDVIKKAASIYKGVDMESFEDEFIICECARITQDTIMEVIKLNKLKSVEEITDYTKAGGFCKSCVKEGGHEKKDVYLVDLLEQALEEMAAEEKSRKIIEAKGDGTFESMGLVQKIKAVESILEEYIRPTLKADGGDVELLDIVENEGKWDVLIKYQGECMSCSMNTTTTLAGIEDMLNFKLKAPIKVIVT